jgi:hypothetical protein
MVSLKQKKLTQANFIRGLSRLKPQERIATIPYLNDNGINSIGECVHNLINVKHKRGGKICKLKAKLQPHKKKLRYLSKLTNNIGKKRKLLQQNGGSVIALIVAAAIPLISAVIDHYNNASQTGV